MGLIYKATNTANGKSYIGQTKHTLAYRSNGHRKLAGAGGRTVMCAAIRKYGFDAFVWEILFDNLDQEDLDVYEMAMIRKHGTMAPDGYNLTTGGSSGSHSEETRKRLSKLHSGITFEDRFGKDVADRMKEAIGKQQRGRKRSRESVERRAAKVRGTKRSAEARQKMRDKALRRTQTEQTKEKLSLVVTQAMTPERRASISESTKALWQNPEYRAKQMAKRRTPEAKAKKSEAAMKSFAFRSRLKAHVSRLQCDYKNKLESALPV